MCAILFHLPCPAVQGSQRVGYPRRARRHVYPLGAREFVSIVCLRSASKYIRDICLFVPQNIDAEYAVPEDDGRRSALMMDTDEQ